MHSEIQAAISKFTILRDLLTQDGRAVWAEIAEEGIQLLTPVLDALPPEYRAPDSRYTPQWNQDRPPDTEGEVAWRQPQKRAAPIWRHEVTCPYCEDTVTIETHAPHPPPTCGQEACLSAHRKHLARERKRKQRAKDKASGMKRKHP